MNNNLNSASAYISADTDFRIPKYDVDKLEELKDKTEIGSYIKFHASSMIFETGKFKTKDVSGFVEEKYPYIFKLDNGRYYQWVDYLIGYVF